jgi:asparagine synthase (glutamine-hydrolysing)
VCGIAVAVGDHEPHAIGRMADALTHRGPNGRAIAHFAPWLSAATTRLSIIDLPGSMPPLTGCRGDVQLFFNGEIYNYVELRRELLARGHVLDTQGDGEVIAHLFEELGENCVSRLRGMFAFAVTDGSLLLVARDRLGIKPLYVARPRKDLLLFASEIKSLLHGGLVQPQVDMQALIDATVLGYPVGRRTRLSGIEQFPPGHTLVVDMNDPASWTYAPRQYYQPQLSQDGANSIEEASSRFWTEFRHVLAQHLRADVPVGAFVSGGLDSSGLLATVRELGVSLASAFTVGDDDLTDVLQATEVAKALDVRLEHVRPTFPEYLHAIPGLTTAEEQPSSLTGAPFYLLCQRASQVATMCFSGEGADEVFGGYLEFLVPGVLASQWRQGLARCTAADVDPSDELLTVLEAVGRPFDHYEEYLERLFLFELGDQLVKQHLDLVDRVSMAFGLEVRVPYVDHVLVELANSLPLRFKVDPALGIGKYVVKAAFARFLPELPVTTVLRRKTGFPSAAESLRSKFRNLCDRVLPDLYITEHRLGRLLGSKAEGLLYDVFEDIYTVNQGACPAGFDFVEYLSRKADLPRGKVDEEIAATAEA